MNAVSAKKEKAGVRDRTGVYVGVAIPPGHWGLQPGKLQNKVGFLGGAPETETGTIVGRTGGRRRGDPAYRRALRTTHRDAAERY